MQINWHHAIEKRFIKVFFFWMQIFSYFTAQKMKFSIKDFFSKCYQIRSFLRIWSHLLKKSLMEIFIFCVVLFIVHVIFDWPYNIDNHYANSKLKGYQLC